jgi:hypothetical protein
MRQATAETTDSKTSSTFPAVPRGGYGSCGTEKSVHPGLLVTGTHYELADGGAYRRHSPLAASARCPRAPAPTRQNRAQTSHVKAAHAVHHCGDDARRLQRMGATHRAADVQWCRQRLGRPRVPRRFTRRRRLCCLQPPFPAHQPQRHAGLQPLHAAHGAPVSAELVGRIAATLGACLRHVCACLYHWAAPGCGCRIAARGSCTRR